VYIVHICCVSVYIVVCVCIISYIVCMCVYTVLMGGMVGDGRVGLGWWVCEWMGLGVDVWFMCEVPKG
jgi:hypothetical protein